MFMGRVFNPPSSHTTPGLVVPALSFPVTLQPPRLPPSSEPNCSRPAEVPGRLRCPELANGCSRPASMAVATAPSYIIVRSSCDPREASAPNLRQSATAANERAQQHQAL